MRVIGTAGHVDHGKSELVLALTGIDPDRLKEEQEREMTIDLGFAWMDLPGGERVGIVDVPGHRDFIENMLAGVGGIDAVLFVVAADEGVMPQTREHLGILDLLGVERGVVALTKVDLVQDAEWMQLVQEDVEGLLKGTSLGGAPMVRVSGKTGAGLKELTSYLEQELADSPPAKDMGRPRLPVDRAFTISGFGTIVTGTLRDGHFEVGDEVVVLPRGIRGRIRGLQSHGTKAERAVPGSRVAINLASVNVEDVARGDVIAFPGTFSPTRRLDVKYRALKYIDVALRHDMPVKLFLGAAQDMARVRLLGQDEVQPGGEGWLQLELRDAVIAARGDRFIVRRPSPASTLGGGQVADAHPKRRYRLRDFEAIERLRKLVSGPADEVLLQKLTQLGATPISMAIEVAGLSQEEGEAAVMLLRERGDLISLTDGGTGEIVVSRETWARLGALAERILEAYHRDHPLRIGMPIEELKSRMRLEVRIFQGLLERLKATSQVDVTGGRVCRAGFRVDIHKEQAQLVSELVDRFAASPYTPPTYKQAEDHLGEELLAYMLQSGELVQVAPDVLFSKSAYRSMTSEVERMIRVRGTVTVAEVRDHFSTSRKYALGLLEHMDEIGLTMREGDERRLKDRRPPE